MPTWMNRTKEAEAERQAEARARRQRKGNCIKCGLALAPSSKQLCVKHLEEQRVYQLARYHAGKRKKARAYVNAALTDARFTERLGAR